MKKYIILSLAAAAMMSACDDDFCRPPLILPPSVQVESTTSLAQFKADYWSALNSGATEVGYANANQDSLIFVGRVCSSDESGNIYKNIIVQSVNEAGEQVALTFSVNDNNIYQYLPFGQEVAVYATGLTIGNYRGLLEFGKLSGSEMTFMDMDVFKAHVIRTGIGVPEPALVDTTATTISEIVAAKSDDALMQLWQSRLVRVDGVRFTDAGQPFAGSTSTNRYITDESGKRIIVRNSSYASFSEDILPYGTGSVTGILSYYGSDWQILLIDESGLQNFDNIAPEPGQPSEPTDAVASLSQDFDASTDIPEGWSNIKVTGNKDWYVRTFDNQNYATVSGYKGEAPFDAWLITPAIDLGKSASKVMSFRSQVNGYGSKTSKFEVYVLNSNNPSEATKTALTCNLPTAPDSGYSSWVHTGDVSLADFSGVVYIGFRYTASQDENYATWCIDNVTVGQSNQAAN